MQGFEERRRMVLSTISANSGLETSGAFSKKKKKKNLEHIARLQDEYFDGGSSHRP